MKIAVENGKICNKMTWVRDYDIVKHMNDYLIWICLYVVESRKSMPVFTGILVPG